MCISKTFITLAVVCCLAASLVSADGETVRRPNDATAAQSPGPFDDALDESAVDSLESLPDNGSNRRRQAGPIPGKIKRHVDILIRQHDADRDGRLDEQEWRGVAGNPQEADLDHDGVITADELTHRIVVYGRHRSIRLAPPSSRAGSFGAATGSDRNLPPEQPAARSQEFNPLGGVAEEPPAVDEAKRSQEAARRSRKFFIPQNRLPAGIAGWFIDRDADGDGQITIREFSEKWTPEQNAEFAGYDRNGDGVITAAESVAKQATVKPETAAKLE